MKVEVHLKLQYFYFCNSRSEDVSNPCDISALGFWTNYLRSNFRNVFVSERMRSEEGGCLHMTAEGQRRAASLLTGLFGEVDKLPLCSLM